MMEKHHDIRNVTFDGDTLVLTIDGQKRRFQLNEISSILLTASGHDRNVYDISPSGYGIHWPILDEDISIDGLMGISHAPQWQRKSA